MSRLKRTRSLVLDTASARAAGIETIAPELELGRNLTLAGYKTAIADTQTKRDAYNGLLSEVDEAKAAFEASQTQLSDLSDRMLAAVGGHFGRNSLEYLKAGGARKSGRRRSRAVGVEPELKKAA